jgi:protein TonB
MTRTEYRLLAALSASLALHLLPFIVDRLSASPVATPAPPPLQASLRPPPAAVPAPPPPLEMPEPPAPAPAQPVRNPPPKAPPEKPLRRETTRPATWTQAVRQHLQSLNDAGQFYPAEAIAQGLEGEVLVLIVIDESGRVVGSRIEQGSGHRLLDDAALRAVRSLRSLPADAPREALLPVRFRLR